MNRILTTMKLNPFAILNLRTDASAADVKASYKQLSMLVHPDKCAAEFAERAQQAFTLVNAARDELVDESKRAQMDELVKQSQETVIARMTEEEAKRRKTNKKISTAASTTSSGAGEGGADGPMPDFTKDPQFESAVMRTLTESLISIEWRRKSLLKEASRSEAQAHEDRVRKRVEAEEAQLAEKEWEQSRQARVSDWRSFMGNKVG